MFSNFITPAVRGSVGMGTSPLCFTPCLQGSQQTLLSCQYKLQLAARQCRMLKRVCNFKYINNPTNFTEAPENIHLIFFRNFSGVFEKQHFDLY